MTPVVAHLEALLRMDDSPRSRRASFLFCGLCLLLSASAGAEELSSEWRNWRFIAPIEVDRIDSARLVSVLVPPSVTACAQPGLADLRVIDAQDREVPFVLRARSGGRSTEERDARLLEPAFLPEQYSQAIFDTGEQPRIHNSIRLLVDSHEDFLAWVELAVGDDLNEWRILRERAPIYQLLKEGMGARTGFSYPDSPSRYVRIRILDGKNPRNLRSARIAHEVVTEAELLEVDGKLDPAAAAAGQSAWTSTADTTHLPVTKVRFETRQESFFRPVRIEVGDDRDGWIFVGSGEIYRMVEGGKPRESLSVEFRESLGSRWRVTVYNRDDPPLPDLEPSLHGTPRRAVFRQEPALEYRLVFGNSRATSPQYEMEKLTDPKMLDAAAPGSLRAVETNGGYADPAPWTERHPSVIWLALGAAVLVLSLLSLRSLRVAS